jgi:hypothetical protein
MTPKETPTGNERVYKNGNGMGELSQQELDRISGGFCGFYLPVTGNTTGSATKSSDIPVTKVTDPSSPL